ncbi:MAG: iron chelate uptake ABC transporter family permease subunit, partial [Candidatus Methanomethylophilaceae archaeon]|nr:iron chelate uptake ABC transporter family permease subunit [Candidatus Methanomethylophilaceae archaeon]
MTLIAALGIAVAVLLAISPCFGAYPVTAEEVFGILWDHLFGTPTGDRTDFVVWDVRLTSSIMAVIVGFALGVCGSTMQAVMRNPLADPYTMGVSSGASLGAISAIVLGFSIIPGLSGNAATVCNAFLLSLIPMTII